MLFRSPQSLPASHTKVHWLHKPTFCVIQITRYIRRACPLIITFPTISRFLHASALPEEIWTWHEAGGRWEALLELPCPQATSQGDGAASSSIRNRCARGLFPGPIKIYFGLDAETKEGKVCNQKKKKKKNHLVTIKPYILLKK